jgi:N-methylhydantoinase A
MISALKLVTIERGHDPRRLSLVVSGGAGPLFAAELGSMLGCRQTIIPPLPGNFSAWGMLAAAPVFHLKRNMLLPLSDQSWPAILSVFSELEPEAETYLGAGARGRKALSLRHSLDMRYAGQEHSVSVVADLASTTEAVAARFHKAHALHFSFSIPDNAIEVTGLCIEAVADVPLIGFAAASVLPPAAGTVQGRQRAVHATRRSPLGDTVSSPEQWPVLERRQLVPGCEVSGPLLIEEEASTTVVPAGQIAEVREWGMICLRSIATTSAGPID